MESMAYLMRHCVADGLACGRIYPQSRNHIVITTAICHPCSGMYKAYHAFIFRQRGRFLWVNKSQFLRIQFVECLCLLQHIVNIDIVEVR